MDEAFHNFKSLQHDLPHSIANYASYDHESLKYQSYLSAFSVIIEPKIYEEAISDPWWVETMNVEIEALQSNNTWTIANLPEDIDCNEAVEPKIREAAWTFFDNRPHQRVIEYISRAGLWDVVRIGKIQLDHRLITVMIERWRPETHTFHLSFGEVTMTLQDVQILFGLRVEGLPVLFPNLLHRNFDWDRLLQVHTRFASAPGDFTRNSRLNISVLIEYIRQQVNQDLITDATLNDRVRRIARLYMLLILGAILFPNISGSSLSLRFLNFVIDLDLMGTYIWGSVVLAYLYWCLCRISIDGIRLGGFLPLLQIWTWERVLPFQPVPVGDIDADEPFIPYGRKWTRGDVADASANVVLRIHRVGPSRQSNATRLGPNPETREHGSEIADDIRRIFDQENQAFQGPAVSDELYQQLLGIRGRRRERRGRGCGDAVVCRGGRNRGRGCGYGVFIHEGVGDVPLLSASETESEAAADDNLVGHYDQVYSPPFHPSPFTPGCSSLPESHNFSTYVAPSWVDEPNPQSYCDMPSRDLTCTLCLSFGSTEFRDVAIPDLAPSVVQDASHGPMDETEKTRVSARLKNRKSKHCADQVVAIKRRDNRDGDNDAHEGLRPRDSIRFWSCGTYLCKYPDRIPV
ncbi:hypothetical protein FXO38_20768 [Capsicum annuum]|nr:hypothetical protein FXO38_20768 [Capsicum annuum]KAF3668874.1 hypothetical protein FXO37_09305 [Capsicum annuum]